jgi:hypothetical protein
MTARKPKATDPDTDALVEAGALVPGVDIPSDAENLRAAAAAFEDDASKRAVIVKLARIMASLPELKPEGKNDHFKYTFIKDTQISGALRPRMAAERLMLIPEVLEEEMLEVPTKNGRSFLTKLKVRFTIIDGDSGDSVSGVGIGYGDDSGDKGANKALTAATKYWLIKLFQIGGEDLESDGRADERAAAREAGSAADKGVEVKGGQISGVARGGRSDKITKAQMTQLFALYKDLELEPAGFILRIDQILGDNLAIDEEGDVTQQLNQYVKNLSADDAGKLISGMIDEKDSRAPDADVDPRDADG